MMLKRIFFVLFFLGCGFQNIHAEETDQFTLPPKALSDIGPIVSGSLYEILEKIRVQTNAEIQMLKLRVPNSRHSAKALALRRNGDYLVNLVYKNTGPGFPRWLRWYTPKKHWQYKEKRPWKTVYWLVFSQSLISLLSLTPTINMYGYYLGTDKLGHFFMQGHTYYQMYHYLKHHGKSSKQARSFITAYGQAIEMTYLGTLINGVYSNADLSANYAGWKFYMNLTHAIKIGDQRVSPILIFHGDKWEFSKNVNKNMLLKPYFSDNLNEAINPCHYLFMRNQIRKQVKKRCSDWIEQKGITKTLVKAKLKEVKQWNGENYGHWLPKEHAITLAQCFN